MMRMSRNSLETTIHSPVPHLQIIYDVHQPSILTLYIQHHVTVGPINELDISPCVAQLPQSPQITLMNDRDYSREIYR